MAGEKIPHDQAGEIRAVRRHCRTGRRLSAGGEQRWRNEGSETGACSSGIFERRPGKALHLRKKEPILLYFQKAGSPVL